MSETTHFNAGLIAYRWESTGFFRDAFNILAEQLDNKKQCEINGS